MKQSIIFLFTIAALVTMGQGCPKRTPALDAGNRQEVERVQGQSIRETFIGFGEKDLYTDFDEQKFDQAVAEGKLVVLYFYANWCPICKKEFPKMRAAFDQVSYGDVVGFRVNFNDNETSEAEEGLARTYGVAYQHTKVFIKNGERVLKAPDSWEKERYIEEIRKFRN